MIVHVLSIEISISLKGIQIFKYSFVTKLILFLYKERRREGGREGGKERERRERESKREREREREHMK